MDSGLPAASMRDRSGIRTTLEARLRAHDRLGTVEVALRAIDDGSVSIGQLYEALAAILVDTGAAWQSGTAEVWEEHLVSGIVRTVVEACVSRVEAAAPEERGGTVVLAAPDDEYHDLGLRMLADRFALAGWRAHFLGANVPVGELTAAARRLLADAVALSASTHFHRLRLEPYVSALTAAEPGLRVWVGGPAFAHDHGRWPAEMVLDPRSVPRAGAG
jgi:MerR family transcriptional regulator, light-induced transcriptional regulator